jgi:glucose-6-phosphate isomerase
MQEGRRNLFETFVEIEKDHKGVRVPDLNDDVDGLAYLEGKEMDYIKKVANKATRVAHHAGGAPIIELKMPDLDERSLGALIYFFEMSCALSGFCLGVNPFNQPGVEAYKNKMFELLGKPGYERK